MAHFDCPECPDQHALADDQRKRIAALEAQVAALAGAIQSFLAADYDANPRRWDAAYDALRTALTADASHLAALDAARREVCAAARRYWEASSRSVDEHRAIEDIGSSLGKLDALAKLEDR